MLIIITVVLSLAQGSITVNAAVYDLPYIIAFDGKVFISDGQFVLIANASNATTVFGKLYYLRSVNCSVVLELKYNTSLQQWQTEEIKNPTTSSTTVYRYGTSTKYTSSTKYVTVDGGTSSDPETYWKSKNVVTNVSWNSYEKAAVGSYSNDLTQLPQGLTESAIRDIIDQQINTSTASGQTAQTVINNTTNQYNLYLSGNINSQTMQQNVKSNIDTLSNLTPNTLLDAMQINNGLTYNQTIQDQLLNTASGNVQSMINGYQNTINNAITNYQNGSTNQEDTVSIINQTITNLNDLIINGTANTTADINAVNAAINSANANLDSVTRYKDLSQEVSDKVQQSDQEELDYLDELEAETTSSIEQLAPSQNFTGGQTGDAQDVLNLVWENEFVKRLLPMCAGFMVVCVVLGIRYKV